MISLLSRNRKLGWIVMILLAFCSLVMLTFRVNAVKSEVRELERQIIAAERQTLLLETEFQTRASQRQLASWNALEFGYAAPRADQYINNRAQLASLGQPRGADAPSPIRVARASVAREVGTIETIADSFSDTALGEGTRTVTAATALLAMSDEPTRLQAAASIDTEAVEAATIDLATHLSQIAPMQSVTPSLSATLAEGAQ